MSNLEEYTNIIDIYNEKKIFIFKEENLRKNMDNYLIWKDDIMMDIYKEDSIFLVDWEFMIDEKEKKLYSNNSENFKRKYIILTEIELSLSFITYLENNFQILYPTIWKDNSPSYDYLYNLYPKIKVNIEIRNILSNIERLRQFYQTEFEKKRILSIKKSLQILQNKIHKRMIPIESYMKLFYKGKFQKINSYDICREIFSYL